MLVLSRKVGEKIMIGENIAVVVSRIAGNRVTVGIEAPDDVSIVRGELEAVVHAFHEPEAPAPNSAARGDCGGKRAFHPPLLAH